MSSTSIPDSFSSPTQTRKRKVEELNTPSPPAGGSTTRNEPSPHTPYESSLSICPGTVARPRGSSASTEPLFINPLDTYAADSLPNLEILEDIQRQYAFGNIYIVKGKIHNLFKQQSTKDCGAAALLMFFSDIVREKNAHIQINEKFKEWLSDCSLANAEKLKTIAEQGASVELQTTKIPMQNPLKEIKRLINQTRLPIISAITHPRAGGHWILVDHVGKKNTYIRDPNTGQAYKIPNKTMKSYYKDIKESALFYSALTR